MNASFADILNEIKNYQTIILHRHTSPDPDALGSQAGLARSLRLAFPDKRILCAGQNDEGDLIWINKMDPVTAQDYQGALVITTDTANTPRVSGPYYRQGDFLIKIDHHPDVDPYADMSFVDPRAAAASEIVADFILEEKLPLTKEVAAPLYAGIVGDTGRFMYADTSAHTFMIAAKLKQTGIDIAAIARQISDVTMAQAKLQAQVAQNMKTDPVGAAYAILTQKQMAALGVNSAQSYCTVSTPGRIKGVEAWNVFVEKADGSYRVHYRSKGPIINGLAAKHDGGGHELAAGANAHDLKEIKQIFAELVEVTRKYNEAKQ